MDGERFAYEGRYHGVRDVQLDVRRMQRPRQPIWVATLHADSAPRIGAQGYPVMLIPYASAETLAEMTTGCGRLSDPRSWEREDFPRQPACRSVSTLHCTKSTTQGRKEARECMER